MTFDNSEVSCASPAMWEYTDTPIEITFSQRKIFLQVFHSYREPVGLGLTSTTTWQPPIAERLPPINADLPSWLV